MWWQEPGCPQLVSILNTKSKGTLVWTRKVVTHGGAFGGACLGLVLLISACGSSGGSSAKGGSSGEAAPTFTGSPIKIFTIIDSVNVAPTTDGMKAEIGAINAKGGIKGRKLELTTCDNQGDANVAAKCARDAIADPDTIAQVASSNSYGAAVDPLVEQAGMPGVGVNLQVAADLKSPVIFPKNLGAYNTAAQTAVLADDKGAKNICLAYYDSPSGASLATLINSAMLAPRNLKLKTAVPISPTATDFTAQVAALSGCDAVAVALTTDLEIRFVRTARQQGLTTTLALSSSVVTPELLKDQLGPLATNLVVVSPYNQEAAARKSFLDDIAKYNKGGRVDDQSLGGWFATKLFADTANNISGDLTRSSLLDAMNKITSYDTGGLTATPLDFTAKSTVLGGTLPRIFPAIQNVYGYDYGDGSLKALNSNKPVDPFNAPAK